MTEKECCGTCKFHRRNQEGELICTNPDSEYFQVDTVDEDFCSNYEKRSQLAKISCCKDCKERHFACWDECKKYQAEREEVQKIHEEERKARYLESALLTHHYTK